MFAKKLLPFLSILALSATLVAQDVPKKMRFTWKCPQKGDAMGAAENGDIRLNIQVKVGGEVVQEMNQTQKLSDKKQVSVLAAEPTRVTKIQVTYEEIIHEIQGEGSVSEDAASIVGNTFIVDFSGESPTVTDEAGEAVSDAIKLLVLAREGKGGVYSGWGPDFRTVLPNREIDVGETFTVTGAEAAGFLPGKDADFDEATDNLSVEMTLTGTKKILGTECGVFDVKLVMSGTTPQDESLIIDLKPKGQFLLGASNMWLYKMNMSGPMKLNGMVQEGQVEVSGTGTATFMGLALYGKN